MVILWYIFGWLKKPEKCTFEDRNLKVSIIIPVRNEAIVIKQLLFAMEGQNYPGKLFEVIVVNDHSTDNTLKIIESISRNIPNMKIVNLTYGVGKKNAITSGINQSNGALIITTDADCIMGSNWVTSVVESFKRAKSSMLVMPVLIEGNNIFGKMQALESLSLQGITGASINLKHPIMASGANLAYLKSDFQEVSGYINNNDVDSGDDVFLLQKFIIAKKGISFVSNENLWVRSPATHGLVSFLQQRIRWSGKTKHYILTYPKLLAFLIWITSVFILIGLLLFPFNLIIGIIALLSLTVKAIIDFLFLFLVACHFKKKRLLVWFIPESVLYILYIVFIPVLSVLLPVKWKGRKIK